MAGSLLVVLAITSFALRRTSNVHLIDHLNINHEQGRHDLLTAFYVDILGCTLDPRKVENLEAGKGTLWANAGAHQFHLPAGKPHAQVFDGVVTLGYDSLEGVRARLASPPPVLAESKFASMAADEGKLSLIDPWGTRFHLVQLEEAADPRGAQPGAESSDARALLDLTVRVPMGTPLAGVARFYEYVLGMPALSCDAERLVLAAGDARADGAPRQTLTFACGARESMSHAELGSDENGKPVNHGAHLSLYLADLREAYAKAEALGVCYVNHRFKRRALTLEEALEQCMFRILTVVDPEDLAAGPLLELEHEVRSATKADGSRYKSYPLKLPSVSQPQPSMPNTTPNTTPKPRLGSVTMCTEGGAERSGGNTTFFKWASVDAFQGERVNQLRRRAALPPPPPLERASTIWANLKEQGAGQVTLVLLFVLLTIGDFVFNVSRGFICALPDLCTPANVVLDFQ